MIFGFRKEHTMKNCRFFAAPLILVAVILAAPGFLPAAEQRTFDVRVEGGNVEVTFALALSEVPSYPVAISAISGPVEELLWTGMLSEGVYRLRAPLTKIQTGALKVVLRTQVTNRTAQGPQNYVRYLIWEGTVSR